LVAFCAQPAAQGFVVLDDAVVHDADLEPVAARVVRMRVVLGDAAVGGPAGVGNAGRRIGMRLARARRQVGDPADGTDPVDPAVEGRQSGRVIAAVLELAQALDQNGHDIAPRDGTDDSAHLAGSLDCSGPVNGPRGVQGFPGFGCLTGRFQFSIVTCLARETVSLPAGASRVRVVPAPRVAPAPTVTGATSWVSLPMKASSPMIVLNLLAPS